MAGDLATTASLLAVPAIPMIRADAALRPGSSADDGVPVTVPRLPAREAADRELSKPRYHENDPGLLQRALDWVWERVNDLLSSAASATPGGWVGIAVIAAVIALLVIALRLRLGTLRPATSAGRGSFFPEGPRSAADHRATAEAHAHGGRWSDALQERMRAIVRSLEERALLDPRPGRTADEAAAEAGRSLADHADALLAAAHAFDAVTYAKRPADEAAYVRLRDLDTGLRRASPRLTPAGAPAAAGAGHTDGEDHRGGEANPKAAHSTLDGSGH